MFVLQYLQDIKRGCSKSLSKLLDVKLISAKEFFPFVLSRLLLFLCEIFLFWSWGKTEKCQHKYQIFLLGLISLALHHNNCFLSALIYTLWYEWPSPLLCFSWEHCIVVWFSLSLVFSLERWSQLTHWKTFGNYHKKYKGAGSHPKSHISCVCLDIVFLSNFCTNREVFLWTTYAFWASPQAKAVRMTQVSSLHNAGWRLPLHSHIHHVWGRLAELAAFLPREKIDYGTWTPSFFFKQVVCNNTAKLCKLLCHTYQTDSSKELEIAKRLLALGR